MASVKKNNLNSFLSKLNNVKGQDSLAEIVMEKVIDKGSEIALQKWGGSAIIKTSGDGLKRSISAVDTNLKRPTIAYREFGTGIVGENSYEGKLPTQDISFEDLNGVEWTTKGWEYAYRYKQTQKGTPFKGQKAQMPMYQTAKELREYIKTDLAKDIKGRIK